MLCVGVCSMHHAHMLGQFFVWRSKRTRCSLENRVVGRAWGGFVGRVTQQPTLRTSYFYYPAPWLAFSSSCCCTRLPTKCNYSTLRVVAVTWHCSACSKRQPLCLFGRLTALEAGKTRRHTLHLFPVHTHERAHTHKRTQAHVLKSGWWAHRL